MQVVQAQEKHVYLLVEMMHELGMSDVGRRDHPDAHLDRAVRQALGDPEWTTLLLREDDGAPVGYAMFRITESNQYPGEKVALLHDFLIRRPFRRRGYGRRFYNHIRQRYFEGAVSRIFLTVPSKNERAVAFWEAVGLIVEGIRMRTELADPSASTAEPQGSSASSDTLG